MSVHRGYIWAGPLFLLLMLAVIGALAIEEVRRPEVFDGPVATGTPAPTGTPTDVPIALSEGWITVLPWTWTTLEQGGFAIDSTGTITIAEPFARAMRDAIGRLE